MKKIFIFLVITAFVVLSCNTNEEVSPVDFYYFQNVATPIQADSKTASQYGVVIRCGHSGTNCPGCVKVGSTFVHVPCSGAGSDCTVSATLSVTSVNHGGLFIASTTDPQDLTDEDCFFMPDRSLFVELTGGDKEVWLNIPEQLAERGSVTGLFTFYNVFFTSCQVFKNQ
jgi:hypothetical protein